MNASARHQGHGSVRRADQRSTHTRPAWATAARIAGIALVSAAVVVVTLSLVTPPEPPKPVAWSSISVDRTGTLWEIATEHAVEGLSVSETVDLIREENGLTSSTLYAGQTLVVPVNANSSLSVAQR